MRKLLKILILFVLPGFAAAQCDTTGILLELQATTNLQGIIFGNNRCLTTATVLAPLSVSGDTLSIDTTGLGGSLWADAGTYTYLTSTTDRAVVGSATELNTSYILQAKGGLFVQGAGSTSGTYAGIFEKADGTDILNIRNDGLVGINNSAPAYRLDIVGDIGQDQPSALYNGSTKMVYGKPSNHNYFFGGAGNVTGNATKNIGIGTSALLNLGATGGFNVAIGFEAGKLITTGQGNVAIGDEALKTNTIGNNNFALGKDALELAPADKNVAVVGLCMAQTTTGEKNVALGYFALNGNTTGFENVAIGNVAMQLNTDGYRNVAIGSEALLSNTVGFGNIALGQATLYASTGDKNIVVGYQSGASLTSGSRNILVGSSITFPSNTGSNQMTIGNIIYATGVDGTGTTVSSGKVGIKTNAPSQDFHVVGNARVTGAVYDSNNDPGTNGQIMSSTVTGWDWVAAATSYTDEQAQDAVGSILVDSPQIDFTYNDATPSITATVIDESITYAKIQNVAANNVLLGNDSGAGADVQELSTAEVQTMLGYIDGGGANQRIAYFTDANTVAAEAAFLYDAGNDRQTIVCTTPSFGAGAAILNLSNDGTDTNGEFLQMRGSITNLLTATMQNTSTAATSGVVLGISQSGNSAGDPYIQTQISGTGGNTTSFGMDNSDANKFKISPNANNPGANADASLVATMDAIPLWGINKDAPGRMLDVGGDVRAINLVNTDSPPDASALGNGLGTGGTVDAVTGGNNGFTVTFTTGTGCVLDGPLFRLTFDNPFTITSHIIMDCHRDVDSIAECDKFLQNGTSPGFIDLKANGTLLDGKTHILKFLVIGQ